MTEPSSTSPDRPRILNASVLGHMPAIIALGLALLYASGALIRTAQLRDAHVRVQDALPLVPIEQLLALGIGIAVLAMTTIVLSVLVLAPFGYVLHTGKLPAPLFAPSVRSSRRERLRLAVMLGVVMIFLLLTTMPLVRVLMFVVGCSCGVAVGLHTSAVALGRVSPNPRRLVTLIVTGYVAVLVVAIGDTWFSPAPLPTAVIRTRGEPVRGALIVARGDAWYVAESGAIRLVPAARIVSATVTAAKRNRRPVVPLWDWVRR